MGDEYGHRLKAFSLRMEKELRKKLEAQAKLNGRTLTSEINYRLDKSLEESEKESELQSVEKSLSSIHEKLDYISSLNSDK
jgi:predicted DNA-binding protein